MNNDTTDYRTYLNPCINFIAFIKALPKIGIDSLLSFFDKHPADEYADSIPIGLFVDEREHLIDILKTINDGFPSEIDYELEYNPEVETCSGNKSRVLFIKTFGKRISLSDMERGEEFHAKFLESSLLYKHRIKALKDELEAHCQRCGIELLPSEQIRISAMDFIFHGNDKLRKKFISFFTTKHDGLKLTATDAVQILLMEVGKDRFDALRKNGLTAKHLWNDLRAVGVIEHNISDRTLNKAAEGKFPKPDVIDAWRAFNK